MLDPNLKDFYARVGRLNKAHAKGFGFEAAGVLGRSHHRRPTPKSRLRLLLPLLFFLASGFALKGAIHYAVGAQTYGDRVAELQNGAGFDRLGATLMAPDPVTLWVAQALRRSFQGRG
jgi:hypothetical protein